MKKKYMLVYGLLLLTTSMAVSLRRDLSILYSRITILILLYSSFFSYISVYFSYLEKRIGLQGELLNSSCYILVFYVISAGVLKLREFYPKKLRKLSYFYSETLYTFELLAKKYIYISSPPKPYVYVKLVKKK